jgi:glycerol uptake facilitator-like aquaporin
VFLFVDACVAHNSPQAMTREVLVTCIFCVAFLVLPQLFAVNKLPKWSCVLLLYPIYNMTIDANGKGSTFGPNVLYTLSALSTSPETNMILTQTLAQLVGSIFGGVLGGLVMQRFFPDDAQI